MYRIYDANGRAIRDVSTLQQFRQYRTEGFDLFPPAPQPPFHARPILSYRDNGFPYEVGEAIPLDADHP